MIETPEGVTLELRLAGPAVRALAWAIDSLIRYAALLALLMLLRPLGNTGVGLSLIAFFLLEWLYPVAFEVYRGGATPGKALFGLRVVNDDGTPVALAASLTRNLLRTADFLPLLYGFGLISMLTTRDAKRLGDLAAGTVVIYAKGRGELNSVPPPGAARPLQTPLAPAEQRLLLNFAERGGRLSAERRAELAALLPPLDAGADGVDPVERLLGYARWLHGRRR